MRCGFYVILFLLLVHLHGDRLPDYMEALVANGYTTNLDDLQIKNVSLPTNSKTATNQVLIKVVSTSINPVDWKLIEGFTTPLVFPKILGSDLAGIVVETCDTCRVQVGDEVWSDVGAYINSSETRTGNTKELGAWAQYALAYECQVTKKPANLNFTEAGVLPLVALTGYKAFVWFTQAPWHTSPNVLILGGSGGTGTAGIQLAKYFGAKKVYTTASLSHQSLLASLGADVIIDYHTNNWYDVIPKGEIDIIYDTVGQAGTADQACQLLAENGHFVTIAGSTSKTCRADVTQSHFINSDTCYNSYTELDAIREIVERGGLRPVIQTVYPFQKIIEAMKISQAGHVVGKLAVDISE